MPTQDQDYRKSESSTRRGNLRRRRLQIPLQADFWSDPKFASFIRAVGWETVGACLQIAGILWREETNSATKDELKNAAWAARIPEEMFINALKAGIDSGLFCDHDGNIDCPYVTREAVEMEERLEQLRDNGRRGGRPKKNQPETNPKPTGLDNDLKKNQPETNRKANAVYLSNYLSNNLSNKQSEGDQKTVSPSENQSPGQPDSDRTTTQKLKRQKLKAIFDARSLEWKTPQATAALRAWLQFRKELAKPLTPSGLQAILKSYSGRIADFIGQSETSIKNGWQGLFPPKTGPAPKSNEGRPIPPPFTKHTWETE